ncbi:hypothetical protein SESBI_03520 [Sesbania bispinosa]|nr:hypothetical protein SESBI_03520 [Sesbania bispinosa]
MGNSLRCCLACVLPCGALDLIRIELFAGFSSSSPETELKRGSIYFLIPSSSLPEKKRRVSRGVADHHHGDLKKVMFSSKNKNNSDFSSSTKEYDESKEKKCSRQDRRHGRVGVWRPHLESILED